MIEAQQAVIGDRHIDDLKPVAIPADVAGGRARRSLGRLIRDEANSTRPALGASPLAELLAKSKGSARPVIPVV